ncbi:hypothetical protein [Acinetobacter larvae]|uniref:Sodium-dependent transporter n=1 Tax=Acinetobacter larvae TaxID=1789224 RepID=A0A1B2M1P7_9GAMM|nr:hypothetical protein [Acinetobacter larvae]AOA59089.1 hypothetical protein BFG52_12495 [Acinetobacter larvae]
MSRWLSPLLAFCLSFIVISALAPSLGLQVDRQIDFWLLWLAAMLLLALPLTYLEVALAKRSKTTALNALMSLTRDADAAQHWRVVGWLAIVFIPFLAAGILSSATALLAQHVPLNWPHSYMMLGAIVLAVLCSYIPRQLLVVLSTVAALAALLLSNTMSGPALTPWHVSALEFGEWGNATILALVASGLGLGVYAQSNLTTLQQQPRATQTAVPVWIAQLLAVIAFGYFSLQVEYAGFSLAIAALLAAALLIQLAQQQLAERGIALWLQGIVILLAMLIWAIPHAPTVLTSILMLWGLVICLIYAIFAGWIMKISHLRKAMNFKSEISYNLWRIAVRIVAPMAILMAIVSFVMRVLA